jgi:hypothetical protein
VGGTNSNITRRHQSEWWRAKCDLVDNGGVFIAKGWAVACDPWLGEDHVGFCFLYLSNDCVNNDDHLEMVVG